MTEPLNHWMDGYLKAWESNDPAEIAALFTPDAQYRSYPWAQPAVGTEAIVALWRETADEPGNHRFSWQRVGDADQPHLVQGHTEYDDGRVYENLWLVSLDADGRARSFTEWYMESTSKRLGPNSGPTAQPPEPVGSADGGEGITG
jgi:hypothetical protein